MTFLNFAMLLGLAAVAIPIVIHLLNRRKATRVEWGAMRFLQEAMASQNRRIRLEEIILLALRCFLLALLALALARPFLPSRSTVSWALVIPAVLIASILAAVAGGMWAERKVRNRLLAVGAGLVLLAGALSIIEGLLQNRLWGNAANQKDIAIVIDGSTSMTIRNGDRTNFRRAIDEAKAVVNAARPADAISIIVAGQVPRVVISTPTNDREEVLAALDRLQPVGGAMQTLDALSAAAASLGRGSGSGKKAVLITDGQRIGWELEAREKWQFIAHQLTAPTAGDLPTPPQIVCRALEMPETFNNVSIASVDLGRQIVGTDREVRISVKVANTGTSPMTPTAVSLTVNGKKAGERTLGEIPPGGAEATEFRHRFEVPGRHVLRAEVVCPDDMSGDNVTHRVVEVRTRLPVLVIDGAPRDSADSAATAIRNALAPDLSEDDDTADPSADDADTGDRLEYLLSPTVVPIAEIAKVHKLDRYAAVILANVPVLPAEMAEQLARYVQDGGGVLVAAGNWTQPEFYNAWSTPEGLAVLPAKLPDERHIDADRPARLALPTFSHPALSQLTTPERADDVTVSAYWPMQPDPQDPDVRVGGRLSDGTPLLIERTLGEGRVLMTPFSFESRDTNFPARGCVVYLLHEAVYYLASPGASQPNYQSGERATLALGGTAAPGQVLGGGLTGEYFTDTRFGKRKLKRVDPTIDFDWGDGGPGHGVGNDDFSVRWTGQLQPPRTGLYEFSARVDDAITLWINGKEVLKRTDYSDSEVSGKIRLKEGQRYDIRIDFREDRGAALCRLRWESRRVSKQPIAQAYLFATKEEAGPTIETRAIAAFAESRQAVAVVGPAGEKLTAHVIDAEDGTHLLALDQTVSPGVYYVVPPPRLASAMPPTQDPNGRVPLAVLGDADESHLERFAPEALRPASDALDETDVTLLLADSADELVASVSGDVPGEEWWKYLAIAVVVALLAEIGLTRWIAANRRTATAGTVDFATEQEQLRNFRSRARQMVSADEEDRQVNQT